MNESYYVVMLVGRYTQKITGIVVQVGILTGCGIRISLGMYSTVMG